MCNVRLFNVGEYTISVWERLQRLLAYLIWNDKGNNRIRKHQTNVTKVKQHVLTFSQKPLHQVVYVVYSQSACLCLYWEDPTSGWLTPQRQRKRWPSGTGRWWSQKGFQHDHTCKRTRVSSQTSSWMSKAQKCSKSKACSFTESLPIGEDPGSFPAGHEGSEQAKD